jgi:hypothetical protein
MFISRLFKNQYLMQIANPIYDVVMKYLLEDKKLARLLLGAIIGAKIEKLDFRPQEYVSNVDTRKIASNRKKEEILLFSPFIG